MDRDRQAEIEGLQGIQSLGALLERRHEQDKLAQEWEKRCPLDEQVRMVASALIDVTEMKAVDRRHKLSSEMEQYGQELSKGLIARLGGDRERFEVLVQQALEQEHQKRDQEPANTPRAYHRIFPKSYTITHAGMTYKLVPKMGEHLPGFWGQYDVLVSDQVVGRMDYNSATESWKVPNHTHKKDLSKAFADFLDWQKNPRRRR